MKASISTFLLLAVGFTYVSSQACHMREIDLCMATGMFHYQSNGVPDDDEKVTEWCETIQEVKDCMGNFSQKCMSPMQREMGSLFGGGASDAEKQFCVPGSETRVRYLKHGSCLAEGAESDVFKGHLKDLQVAIETVFESDHKKRLPTLCCGFSRFNKGSVDNTKRMCGEDAVEMLGFIMNMMVSDLPNTICANFDAESDQCKDLLPPTGTRAKGAESKSQIAKLMDTVFGNL